MNYDYAQNKSKLRRIMDKMPNATPEELKAEYIKQGGLVTAEETPVWEVLSISEIKPVKKTVAKKVKEVVTKAVKKVTKKK